MQNRDIIVIGASAGGVEALKHLVGGLPANLPASVFVVLHIPRHGPDLLPEILARAGRLRAIHPEDRQVIEKGVVYIAPPDYHLLVKPGEVRLTRGPRENGHRPAIDALFRTAARSYTRRVIGVVLTGALDDGTAGLLVVKRCGGLAVVQDPDDALYPSMPRSAMEYVAIDHCVPLTGLPKLLMQLVSSPIDPAFPNGDKIPSRIEEEADMAEMAPGVIHRPDHTGSPSVFGCPECGGVLWELHDQDILRFRCRVGHAWTAKSLLAEQTDALEGAFWSALRALEERVALAQRLADRARANGHTKTAESFLQQIEATKIQAEMIRKTLLNQLPDPSTESFQPAPQEENTVAATAGKETTKGVEELTPLEFR